MSMPKGYPSTDKEKRVNAEFVTISPSNNNKNALDVRDTGVVHSFATDLAEAGSTTTTVVATAHAALKGDKIRFTSGPNVTLEADVFSIVDANSFVLAQTLPVAPGVGDGFEILRQTSLTVSASGGITSGPIQFNRDTGGGPIATTVSEDTVTPANNRPLPVQLTDFSGDMVLNAANLNLEVQLDHNSANPDSVQIGDGTEIALVSAAGELQTKDDGAATLLTAIDADTSNIATDTSTIAGDTTSIDIKTPALGQAAMVASVPVAIASDQSVLSIDDNGGSITIDNSNLDVALSTRATEATLLTIDADTSLIAVDTAVIAGDTSSLDAKLPAQGAALTAASTPVNIASDQTVPVSAASLPLPTGAATEATLSTIDADTSALAGTVAGSELQVDVVTIPAVDLNYLDTIATTYTDASSTNIPGNATAPLELIASTAADIKKIQVADTTGAFLEIMTGAAAAEVRKVLLGPGSDSTVEVSVTAGTRLSVRRIDDAAAIAVGGLMVNYLG